MLRVRQVLTCWRRTWLFARCLSSQAELRSFFQKFGKVVQLATAHFWSEECFHLWPSLERHWGAGNLSRRLGFALLFEANWALCLRHFGWCALDSRRFFPPLSFPPVHHIGFFFFYILGFSWDVMDFTKEQRYVRACVIESVFWLPAPLTNWATDRGQDLGINAVSAGRTRGPDLTSTVWMFQRLNAVSFNPSFKDSRRLFLCACCN